MKAKFLYISLNFLLIISCSKKAEITPVDDVAEPTIQISSNAPLCAGEDLQLSESGGDAISWTWIGPNSFNETNQNTGIAAANTNATGDYTVDITGANGCTNTATQTITINALPDVDFQNLEAGYCENETSPVVINTNQSGGDFTFSGSNGFNDLGNGTAQLFPDQMMTGAYNLTFQFTDSNGCSDEVMESFEIYVEPNVMAETDGKPCSGQEFFTLMETGGNATHWAWTGPNNFNSTNQNPNVSNGVGVEGLYEVTATDDNGCSNSATIDIAIALGESFISNFLISNLACVGDSVKMIEVSETNIEPTAIFWDFGDGNTSTERDPYHIYQNPGSYLVQVEVFDEDCGNLSLEKTIEIENCRRLDLEGEGAIKTLISPNPTEGEFLFQMELLQEDNVIIEILDAQGKLIERLKKDQISSLEQRLYIEQPGIHFMHIKTQNLNNTKVLKIVVIR